MTTQPYQHDTTLKLGANRGNPRVWIEGNHLLRAGFTPQSKFRATFQDGSIVLELAQDGDRTVSGRTRDGKELPIIDINAAQIGAAMGADTSRIAVRLTRHRIDITPSRIAGTLRLIAALAVGALGLGGPPSNTARAAALCAPSSVSISSSPDEVRKLSQPQVAALFVDESGCYANLGEVDAWPESRDARLYSGPLPVVAHPPCQRWGRFWHGSTRKPHQFRLGEDRGCFASALTAVRNYGGILEHPAGSCAWGYFGLNKPHIGEGWIEADTFGGWTCQIDQRHYGHSAPKPTWLYAVGVDLPELNWEKSDRTPPQWMIDRYGESKARKIGVVAMIGGKDKVRIRNATPIEFRDLLIRIATSRKTRTP